MVAGSNPVAVTYAPSLFKTKKHINVIFYTPFPDSRNCLRERNQLVLQFINGCCNINYEDQTNTTTLFTIATALEMIYFIRNINLVLPHCFLVNLLQSFVSGSKTVSTLNGKVTPGSSYSTYKKWVNVKGKDVVKCPDGDQVTFFDNIGKYISKNYRVSSQKYT